MSKNLILLIAVGLGTGLALGQDWEREEVKFGEIENYAKELAAKPYEAPDKEALPGWMKKLSYDQYRDIRFDPERALWAGTDIPFRAMFFHPGYLFREPVMISEFTDTHRQKVRLTEAFFKYGNLIGERGELSPENGFAGLKLLARLNDPERFDELAAFQGASYWRALGKNQRYGISARGIAVDTGAEGVQEEFPVFREFWLRKPEPDSKFSQMFALLDGPSYTGAYSFTIYPGDDTVVDVKAVLFTRKEVKRLGIAPMSSMYWFGENSRRRFDDFRPEVHDSDGLAIYKGSGERLWRPVSNDSGQLEFSFFQMEKCKGFGLLQRDRRFEAYEDGEAAYESRPSLWIEPTSDWGPGSVMLMEIPTHNELADNTVAMWQPAVTPKAGERVEFHYKQHWTMNGDPAGAGGHVVATRTGVHDWQPEQRTVVVEFFGENLLEKDGKLPEAFVEADGETAAEIVIQGITVQSMPGNKVRLAFQLKPAEEGAKLSDIKPVELRAALKKGENFLTETWVYRIKP
ncbi:glucan biosynthesis protein [Luteolibacter algae]|uniref:Glucans biosynthesis protein G n=1 Tax=Luteolibacter algae TaxID=454151 RepID=A0ABW5D7I2_9BACT